MSNKIILSVVSIFTTLIVLGTATYAYFNSEASSADNTFGAGTLVLNVTNGSDGSASPVFNLTGQQPGDTASQVLRLKNNGTAPIKSLSLKNIGITITDGGTVNLGDVLTLDLYHDANRDGKIDAGDTVLRSAHLTDAGWANFSLLSTAEEIPKGSSKDLIAELSFDTSADSTYQAKGITFDFNFLAGQM